MSINMKSCIREMVPKKYQVRSKYIFNKLLGRLEAEMNILEFLVSKNDLVIDVGGNRGVYAYKLWQLGCAVEVFEPNPVCSSILLAWAKDKGRVNVHTVALSNEFGLAKLFVPVDSDGNTHDASASLEHTDFSDSKEQEVLLSTMDSFQFQNVSLIKVDVEGHELSVLEGAKHTIETSKPALLIEIEQRHLRKPISEVFDYILGLGYLGFFLDKVGLKTLDAFDVVKDQAIDGFVSGSGRYINNFVFLHNERLADGQYHELFQNFLTK